MKFIVQNPPDPANGQFNGTSPLPWQRAMASWAQNLNGSLQQSFPLNYGAYVQGPKFGQLPIFGTQRWNGAYPNSFITAGNGVSISGTSTVAINANVAALTAGAGIAISGTSTNTVALHMTPITNSLGTNVSLTSTSSYFDGPSVAQGTSGTWWVSGNIMVTSSNVGDNINCKLWDGSTVIDSGQANISTATGRNQVSLSGYLANPAGNLKISAQSNSTSAIMQANSSGNGKDSTISAIKIG